MCVWCVSVRVRRTLCVYVCAMYAPIRTRVN